MLRRDGSEAPTRPIGFDGLEPAILVPVEGGLAVQDVEHHLVVVAEDRDQPAPRLQRDDPVEDPPAVRPPVDVVAEHDDLVVGGGSDRLDQRVEGLRAAVDVADGDRAARHGSHFAGVSLWPVSVRLRIVWPPSLAVTTTCEAGRSKLPTRTQRSRIDSVRRRSPLWSSQYWTV